MTDPRDIAKLRAEIASVFALLDVCERERDEARKSAQKLHRTMQAREGAVKNNERKFWYGCIGQYRNLSNYVRAQQTMARFFEEYERAEKAEARATAAEAALDKLKDELAAARETIARLCGESAAIALGVPHPIRMPELEKAAAAVGLDPCELWPWVFKSRPPAAAEGIVEAGDA